MEEGFIDQFGIAPIGLRCTEGVREMKESERKDWEVLSIDLKICYRIYEAQKKKEPIWLGKLVEVLKNDASKATISKTVDKLFDLGAIDGEWKRVGDKWMRTLYIAGEAESLIKGIYRYTKPTS